MLERVQRGAAGRVEAKWQKFPPERRAHEAQHCVHHKSRSVVLIPSNLISPRGSALICQEFFWCRKPPPVRGGRAGKERPPYCFCAVEEEDIFFHLNVQELKIGWISISVRNSAGPFFFLSLQGKAHHSLMLFLLWVFLRPLATNIKGCSFHRELQINCIS